MDKRFCFTVDDNIRVFKELTEVGGASVFDHPYLAAYRRLHEKHGLCVQLNLFYECKGFTLASMTDRYRDEFEKNADWLKMSFHSRLENVRPYEHSGYEEVYADCKAVEDEILRFAGEKTLAKTTTVHYCLLTEGGYMTEGGVRNTTHAFDREGNLVGRYFKEHPAPSEVKTEKEGGHECDVAYSYEFRAPTVITIEGIRFAFLT